MGKPVQVWLPYLAADSCAQLVGSQLAMVISLWWTQAVTLVKRLCKFDLKLYTD